MFVFEGVFNFDNIFEGFPVRIGFSKHAECVLGGGANRLGIKQLKDVSQNP